MNTTTMIKKTKEEIQKLRTEYLQNTGDAQALERIRRRIEYHKRVLADLGGGE